MNKNILVTGAASGIGHACAKLLLERGARVAAFDPQLGKMQEKFEKSDNLLLTHGDVSVEKDCIDAVSATVDLFGQIDGTGLKDGLTKENPRHYGVSRIMSLKKR